MKKKLSKTIWYGTEVDESGNAILPGFTDDPNDLTGLHLGELYLHLLGEKASLWTPDANGNIIQISGNNEGEGLWTLKTREDGSQYIFSDLNVVTRKGITMYANDGSFDIPSIYDGIPIDWDTIIRNEDGELMVNPEISLGNKEFSLGSLTNVGAWADNIPSFDRVMVQKKDSNRWESLSLEEIGSASFENVKESGEGNAYTGIELSEDKKTLTLKKGETFAKQTDYEALNKKVADFFESEDTDTIINKWKELEVFLTGMKESDDLAKILSEKADKGTTFADYGITDAYTKTEIDSELKKYVTLDGKEEIKGAKDFTGGLSVNGSPIVYNKDKKYWMLTGDLLVTGGMTMFADEGTYTPSTIMDAIKVDGTTIRVNPTTKELEVIGDVGGGLDQTALENYLESNKYLTQTIGDEAYLKKEDYTADNVLEKLKTVDGAGSGLDADMLDGFDSNSFPLLNGILNTSDNLDDALRAGYYKVVSPTNLPDGIYPYGMLEVIEIHSSVTDSEERTAQVYYPHTSGSEYGYCGLAVRVRNNGSWSGWRKFTTSAGLETTYLKLTGGTLTGELISREINPSADDTYSFGSSAYRWKEIHAGKLNVSGTGGSWISGKDVTNAVIAVSKQLDNALYYPILATKSAGGHVINFGGYQNRIGFYGFYSGQTENVYNWATEWDMTNGLLNHTGSLTVAGSAGIGGNLTVPSATVGGVKLYKSQEGVLYVEGNLVVKGGVTAYGDTSVTASTIMDAIRVDGVTISKANGYLEVIGGAGGGLDEDSLENYLQSNKYLTQATGDARYVTVLGTSGNYLTWTKNGATNNITIPYATKATQDSEGNTINSTYLKLSGGTVSGNITINGGSASSVFTIRRSPSVIAFQNSGGTSLGYLGFSGTNTPCMYTTSSISYTLLHSNNYNSYAPKLDGTGASGTWGISISGNASMATRLTNERTIWGNPFDGTKNVSGDMTDVGSISMKGHLYLMGVSDTSSIANKTQILFGTSPSNVHIALSSNKNSLIINPSESTTTGQIVLGVNGGNTIFKSTGNFGIGVENPSIKCEVDGDIGNDRCLMRYSTSNPYLKLTDTYNGVNYNHYIAAYEGKMKLGKSLSIGITIDDGGNVEVSGNLIVKGGITMYGTESAEGYTSDFVPRETGTYNIGSSERRWKSLFTGTADLSDGLVMSTIDNDKAFNDKGITFGENGIVRFSVNRSNDLGIYAGGRIFIRPSSLTEASSVGMVIETTGNAYLSGGLTIGENSSNANIVNNAYKLYVTGKAYITSTITQNSDIRYKEIHKDLRLSLATMAEAPSFEFHFTDGETKDTHIGTSAQYWQCVEGVVREGADGRLGMDYASLGVVIGISLAKEVAKYESETDRRIRLLEKENEELRNEINKLKVA